MKKIYGLISISLLMSTARGQNWNPSKQTILKEGTPLSEVIVTASKIPQSSFETGKVVIVIDSLQLEHSGGKSISQLLGEQTGITVGGSGGNIGSQKSIFLRGATSQNTLILIDGIPISDPSADGQTMDPRTLNINQFSRIEILKGGQSTIYGSEAVAGVINFITKKNVSKPISVTNSLGGGSLGTFKQNINVGGNFEKTIQYQFNYSHFKTQGIQETVDNGTDTLLKGHFPKNGFEQHSFTGNIFLHPSSHFEINPFIRFSNNSGSYTPGAFLGGNFPYHLKTLQIGLNSIYHFNKNQFLKIFEGNSYTNRNYISSYGESIYKGFFNQIEANYFQDINPHFAVIAGISYQFDQTADTTSTIKNPSYHIISPFLDILIKNFHHFYLEAGIRYNHHSAYPSSTTYSFNPSYHLSNHTKVFGTIATSYRAPTLYNLYGGYGVASPFLKPENSVNYELGISSSLLSKSINYRLVGFYRKGKNVIVYNYKTNSYFNEDQEKVKGIEFESTYNLTSNVTLKGFYSFLTGTINTLLDTSGKQVALHELIRRPKNSYGLSVIFQPKSSLFMSLNFRSYLNRFDEDFTTYKIIPLANYSLLDGYGEYSFINGRLKVFAQLNNILNKDYTEIYGYTTLRFNMMAGIQFRWF